MQYILTPQEEKYLILKRVYLDIQRYGAIDPAVDALEKELEQYESLWSCFSSDSLGHGITCVRLKINFLKRLKTQNEMQDWFLKKTSNKEFLELVNKEIYARDSLNNFSNLKRKLIGR